MLWTILLSLATQPHPDVVRGRVTAPDHAAVAGADVTVTRTTDGAARAARTDSLGGYAVVWPDAAGRYVVQIAAPGFATFRRIVTRGASDSAIVVDATLQRAAPTRLAAVVAKATRPVPDRRSASDVGPGATDQALNPTFAARRLAPDVAGDLDALASIVPGTLSTAGGVSVLGLAPTQNLVTLNGLAFPSGDIPRATPTTFHLTTSSYDPSIGWFSGARANVDIAPGGPFASRTTYWTADAPALQFTDAAGAHTGQRYGDLDASVGGGGLARDRFAYTFGAQVGRRTSSPATLLDAGDDVLRHAGLAPDSAARALAALRRLGVPLGTFSAATSTKASFLGRLDVAPYDWNTLAPARRTLGLVGYAKLAESDGQALAATATPGHGGRSTLAVGAVQAQYSAYVKRDYLAELRTGLSSVHATSAPYLALPDARVLVGSANALSSVQFGGNAALGASSDAWTWESRAELQFYPAGRSIHRVKLTADARLDGSTQTTASNRYGTFTYNSLADLAAERPASFARTLQAPSRTAGAWNGFVALGDLWHPRADVQVAYGLRADASAATRLPAYDARVDSALALRTDRGPATWGLSPRLGFAYNTATPRWLVPAAPLGVLRGGVGAFRDLMDPRTMAAASAATGLPGALRRLTCVGASVPAATWQTFAADDATVPGACLTAAPALVDAAPDVVVVDRAFTPPTSWRASIGWSSSVGSQVYAIDGTLALDVSQPGAASPNFADVRRFTTADEGRAVFASPAAIVPATGVVSASDARRTGAFGAVTNTVSDLRSLSRVATLTVRPYLGAWVKRYTGDLALSYTLSSVRAQQRGFDATTFDDPSTRYWARGDLDARHQFTAGLNVRPHDGLTLFMYGHARSGLPFTPVVGSDVNGDGLANDRAFVFDPAHADAGVADGMRALLASAPSVVRACLTRQLGAPAAPASCEGPWSATLNVAALLDPALLHTPRATVRVNFANVLGGVDLLAHGGAHLRGWGGPTTPDAVLYRVTSFDVATRRFAYAVNPRFGSTSASATTARTPFRVTLDVSLDVAPPLSRQQLGRWLAPGRGGRAGKRLTAGEMAQRYARSVPDPYTPLLENGDSLVLTPAQVTALQRADDRFRARMDSTWRALGAELAALPDAYDAVAVDRHADATVDAAWELARRDLREQLDAILSPVQLGMLAGWTKIIYTATRPLHYRLFITGG